MVLLLQNPPPACHGLHNGAVDITHLSRPLTHIKGLGIKGHYLLQNSFHIPSSADNIELGNNPGTSLALKCSYGISLFTNFIGYFIGIMPTDNPENQMAQGYHSLKFNTDNIPRGKAKGIDNHQQRLFSHRLDNSGDHNEPDCCLKKTKPKGHGGSSMDNRYGTQGTKRYIHHPRQKNHGRIEQARWLKERNKIHNHIRIAKNRYI
nr:hypothetical protein [Desulfotalea psychrophila]